MGVGGLLSFCLDNRKDCVDSVNLIDVVQQQGSIELLVDFYSFEHYLLKNIWKTLSMLAGNDLLRILGGEYGAFDAVVSKLVKDLMSLEIHLVFFIDGAKGSSKVGTVQKLDTWMRRHRNDMTKMKDILSVLKGKQDMKNIPISTSVRPVLLEVQILETLQNCKCEIVQCPSGEADFVIARNLLQRPRAYAVVSNDSDFCIFENCAFVPHELFDLNGDLRLGQPQLLPEKPLQLMVGVIKADKVASCLRLEGQEDLIEFSIVGGNDFTSQFTEGRLRGKINMQSRKVKDLATWVRKYRKVENHPFIGQEMQHNQKLSEAIKRSREFYKLCLGEAESLGEDHLTHFIEDQVERLHYPAAIMSMHLQFYWHRMLLEDCSPGHPCAEVALSDLRSHLYVMLLKKGDHGIIEYGRTPHKEFQTSQVQCSQMKWLPEVSAVDRTKIFQNLRTFGRIMTHYEPFFQTNYFKRYGRKTGFTCYVLRYFLRMNTGYNLLVTKDEFLALLAMAFRSLDEPWYCSLRIEPTERCVTIGNWFQDVYRHAYLFLGKVLYLSHEFPLPKEIFSGAVWTAFYMMNLHAGDLQRMGFPAECGERICWEMNEIIHERRHLIQQVVEHLLHFNTRF